MHGSTQPEESFSPGDEAADNEKASRTLAEVELDSALQLLMERAQYITGATGAALALPQGEEMVCRASAGGSAPAVGVRLQVRSGLTGESISRRQLLRCNNAETDPRVNLETCRALGIASIVVLPLLRRNGEVRGLLEMFSDHPYAFEERDLIALERMADLTSTALDLAEQREKSAPVPVAPREVEKSVEASKISSGENIAVIPLRAEFAGPAFVPVEPPLVRVVPSSEAEVEIPSPPASVPEAMLRVQKCANCGFPVSEGRTFCLDCEKKDQKKHDQLQYDQQVKQQAIQPSPAAPQTVESPNAEDAPVSVSEAASEAALEAATEAEFVPAFLANSPPVSESWMANHVNLLAIAVLVLGILVAVVVFR